jgi:hypothetical protein
MDATTVLSRTFSDGIRFGLDESGARTEADTKRPKSSVFERARERVSMILAEGEPTSARVIVAVIFLVRFSIQRKMNIPV